MRGENEVVQLLRKHGLSEAKRMPLSGAVAGFEGDVSLNGFAVEIKYRERLDLWGAIRQAAAAARGGRIPIVVFRRNRSEWYVVEPLESWAAREAELREWRHVARGRTFYDPDRDKEYEREWQTNYEPPPDKEDV